MKKEETPKDAKAIAFKPLLSAVLSPEMQKIEQMQGEILSKMIKQINDKEEEIFTMCLRNYAEPPIKGKITKGKIKWRGIVKISVPMENKSWLEQRGKRISPIIEFTTPFCKGWLQNG